MTTPAPDFLLWSHENLAKFAKDANEENKALRSDLQHALKAWRDAVKAQELGKLPTK